MFDFSKIPILNFLSFENLFGNLSFFFLFSALIYFWIKIIFIKKEAKTESIQNIANGGIGNFLILLANFSLSMLLLLRWINSGHFPLSNLYESLIFLSWSCTTIHLILLYTSSLNKTLIQKLSLSFINTNFQENIIGSLLSPLALLLNAYASFSLPKEMQQAAPLVPALQSNWLMMHVTVMILSYACLLFGSLLSIAFLVITAKIFTNPSLAFSSSTQETRLRPSYDSSVRIQPLPSPPPPPPSVVKQPQTLKVGNEDRGGAYEPTSVSFGSQIDTSSVNIEKNKLELIAEEKFSFSKYSSKLNNIIDSLDNYSYRIIGIGFCFLTIGILSGAVWANEAWGSYWSWDPKETWAFLTWLVYAIYLHTRLIKGWNGKKPAFIASFGFLTVWVCFLGVNLIGKGLHSYGFWAT